MGGTLDLPMILNCPKLHVSIIVTNMVAGTMNDNYRLALILKK